MLMTVILVLIILAVIGALPLWPHSNSWGPYPASGLGLVLLILLVLILVGRV